MTNTMLSRTERPWRIAVLMGGPSREREVSLASGQAVCDALSGRGHEVVPVVLEAEQLPDLRPLGIEVAFVALHGRFGEDGGVQRACAAQGIPYTGSGPEASALAFDKALARRRFMDAGLTVAPARVLEQPLAEPVVRSALRELGPRVVLKPLCEGSSIGLFLVEAERGLREALLALRKLGQPVLAERFVPGRELTLAVLGDEVLAPVEMITTRELFDFAAKYDPAAGTRYVVEPPLDRELRARLAGVALRAHQALGCRSVSRVDVRLPSDGKPVVLEVNTIPGMTATSLLPKAAAARGIDFATLCERLVRDAIQGVGPRPAAAASASLRARHEPSRRRAEEWVS